jgi:hypothetical protein
MDVGSKDPYKGLKRGDRLPCGCEVVEEAWDGKKARHEVNEAIADIKGVEVESLQRLPPDTTFSSLGFDESQIKRLWEKFFVQPEAIIDFDAGTVSPPGEIKLSYTIEGFVTQVQQSHGITFRVCDSHFG